jgi:arylsulfatase A-like enzyme
MPFVERLRREGITFPRAVSVAPWTLPSHASLFTGLYPWEHGCHGKASLTLDPRIARLPQMLRSMGYRSLSLSANPIIGPFYGLVDGFDVSEWGEWWEQVNRLKAKPSYYYESAVDGRAPAVPVLSRRHKVGRTVKTALTRVPWVLSAGESVLRRTVDPHGRWVGNMNPWIEPELERWLARQPMGQPTFCFINFLDAHEPYLLDPGSAASWRDWWQHMRIPQDVLALLAGPHPPTPEDLERLHDLYRGSIATLDRRIERIVDIYRKAGRWEGALMILTSDHGQAFGEHGMVWHGVRTDEEMLRVPLILRLPQGEQAGRTGTGWASPLDTVPTVFEAIGAPRTNPASGVPLQSLVGAERPDPLLSAGDGTEWNRPFMEKLNPQRRLELNLFSIAAYFRTVKVVVDATTDRARGYDLSVDPPVELPPDRLERSELSGVVQQARRAAVALLHPSSPGASVEVEERLRSWGYG